MSSVARVAIHSSQFPEAVQRDLLQSLHARQVNHKFHYDSIKQTQKWLALHQAFSPSRTDADCAATYDRAFAAAAGRVTAPALHLLGLGCGGGQKDTRLLRLLRASTRQLSYTPSDVSTAMVLVARNAALAVLPDHELHPLVCDLATADDLPAVLDQQPNAQAPRLVTFFGMIPNFEPRQILPRLAAIVRPGDQLLFSANLSPGADYLAGIQKILPLYDNQPTRDWLLTFLFDLGVEPADGQLHFTIEDDPAGTGLKRIAAHFHFAHPRTVRIESASFDFATGSTIRLFFSYRHTPAQIRALLAAQGLAVLDQWITQSAEEGIFLCQPA